MGLKGFWGRTKLFRISKSETVSDLGAVPPPFGKELYLEISSRWTTQLNGLHEQYRNGLIENSVYLQAILDYVADWGTELSDAFDEGKLHIIYLAIWHKQADELHKNWQAARDRLRTILETKGVV